MSVICCGVCRRDPCGRWTPEPAMIFIDPYRSDGGSKYRCRAHLSPQREEKIQQRERERGWPKGTLR